MSEIVYKVHACQLPEFDGLGLGSVWKCDCGKLYELYEFPRIQGYHFPSIPAVIGWVKLAPRWFNEETQTPVPLGQRIIIYQTKPTKWQKLINKFRGE
jgi:hypothetical protein